MTDEPLDVAVVTPRYPPVSTGGGQRSAELLATTLRSADGVADVTVYSFDGQETVTRDGVTVRRLGEVSSIVTEFQNLAAGRLLRGKLSDYDVVHGYNMELLPAIGYLCESGAVPSVATLNSYHFFRSSVTNTTATGLERAYELVGYPTTGRLLRHYMRRIDGFIALSAAIERIYRENEFARARIEQIPNMMDPSFTVPESEGTNEGYSLLYVGTLTENKGVSNLIRAMADLPADIRLRVAGSGPQADELSKLANELGVSDRIDFEGWVEYERIGKLYATADLFVHPGIWPEPFNRTVLEAMQAGLPVVCTDVGGPPEAIGDDRLLCEPGNPDSLAVAVRRAREVGDDVGRRNRKYVEENHAPAVVVPAIVDLYRDLQ